MGNLRYFTASAVAVALLFSFVGTSHTQPLFEDVAADYGLADVGPCGGLFWYDFDLDGDLDLFVSRRFNSDTYFFRNDGNTFTRLDGIGLPTHWDGGRAGPIDFDHDGDLDLYIRCYHTPSPFLVYQDGQFIDQTQELGLPWVSGTRAFLWYDFNRDGWMDLLWANAYSGFHLYRNGGGIGFIDVTSTSGLPDLTEFVEICEADVDLDHDVDLFATRLNGDDHFFLNAGNGIFVDWTVESGLDAAVGRIDCKWADFDNDKYPDLLTQSWDRHTIWHNNGDSTFTEMQVYGTETTFESTPPNAAEYAVADFDMDGDLDFYCCRPGGCGFETGPNQLFLMDSIRGLDIWFHDAAPSLNMDILPNGFAIVADFDGDYDLDLTVSGHNAPIRIYRNNTNSLNCLQTRILGPNGELDRWHTRVEVYPHGSSQILRVSELNYSNVNRNGFNNYFVVDDAASYDLRLYFTCGVEMTPETHPQLAGIVPSQINRLLTVYMSAAPDAADDPGGVPVKFGLGASYPNPFNATTTIPYSLSESDYATVSIHNVLGQEVAVLVNGLVMAGTHRVTWNAADQASGIYLIRLEAGQRTAVQKIALLK